MSEKMRIVNNETSHTDEKKSYAPSAESITQVISNCDASYSYSSLVNKPINSELN